MRLGSFTSVALARHQALPRNREIDTSHAVQRAGALHPCPGQAGRVRAEARSRCACDGLPSPAARQDLLPFVRSAGA